jgi:hypothetical protein
MKILLKKDDRERIIEWNQNQMVTVVSVKLMVQEEGQESGGSISPI